MLEPQPVYQIGNPRRPYSWNSSWREKLRESEQAKAGSSGTSTSSVQTSQFHCNNCNLQVPIEELRLREQNQMIFRNRSERPIVYHEMLLCDPCKLLYRQWLTNSGSYYEHRGRPAHRAQRGASQFDAYQLIPLSDYCQAYWRNKIATKSGCLPLPGGQVPPSAEACQTSTAPQGLR